MIEKTEERKIPVLDLFLDTSNQPKTIIKLSLLNSMTILEQSHGEVQNPETLSYRNGKPVKGGLFCEEIFGPMNDYECHCGKYSGILYENMKCPDCKVIVTKSHIRRERKGHITLSEPVIHPWFLSSYKNPICLLLNIKFKDFLDVVSLKKYCLVDDKFTTNYKLRIDKFDVFSAEEQPHLLNGAKAFEKVFYSIELKKMYEYLLELYKKSTKNMSNLGKRLQLLNNMINSNIKPENMILRVISVLPAGLRTIVTLDNGFPGTTDINNLYRVLIIRNKRLENLKSLKFALPALIMDSNRLLLQEAVNWLFDNNQFKHSYKIKGKIQKSLTEMIKGKRGILRLNLLGRRVNFSARSVIVVDSNLKLNECGIPKLMALELFKPFLAGRLIKEKKANSIREAYKLINAMGPYIWKILEDAAALRMVLLNRAPSLHMNSIQAFDIKLVDGYALKIHPLVCKGYNADFDGDQMSVHLQVLPASNVESKLLMYSIYNIFSPSNGKPLVEPVREMILGLFAVSRRKYQDEAKLLFYSEADLRAALLHKKVNIDENVQFYFQEKVFESTPGLILFNEFLPEEFRDYSSVINNNSIEKLIENIEEKYGIEKLTYILDQMKNFGVEFATKLGISMSMDDIVIPEEKKGIIAEVESKISDLHNIYDANLMTRKQLEFTTLNLWSESIDHITNLISEEARVNVQNDLYTATMSGARGNITQLRQLGGIRGIVSDAKGELVIFPIIASYKEGLNSIDQFLSSYGSRKGTIDKNFKTAIAGYLTRKLVSVAHSVIIHEYDCQTEDFVVYENIHSDSAEISLDKYQRLIGRTLAETLEDLPRNHLLTAKDIKMLREKNAIVKIRTVFNCQSKTGICCLCYGLDVSRKNLVQEGRSVGVIAAQSVGEPALQMTLRTFHSGGVSSLKQTTEYIYASSTGEVLINTQDIFWQKENKFFFGIAIRDTDFQINTEKIRIPVGSMILVQEKQSIKNNDLLAIYDNKSIFYNANITGKIYYLGAKVIVNAENRKEIVSPHENIKVCIKSNESEEYINIKNGSTIFFDQGENVQNGDLIAQYFNADFIAGDIVNDLQRIQSLFELNKPVQPAILAKKDGICILTDIEKQSGLCKMSVVFEKEIIQEKVIERNTLLVKNQEKVLQGQQLTKGDIDYSTLLNFKPLLEAKIFLMEKIKSIYMNSNIIIQDKHLEILVNRMFTLVNITSTGDSAFSTGEIVDINIVHETNRKLAELSLQEASFSRVITGITRTGLRSSSFLSACSFQDTKRVLAECAVNGAIDNLIGLSENVICGNQVPCGTGLENNKNGEISSMDNSFYHNMPLSIFLKQVNVYKFTNAVLKELKNRLEIDVNFTEKKTWLNDIIEHTKNIWINNLQSKINEGEKI